MNVWVAPHKRFAHEKWLGVLLLVGFVVALSSCGESPPTKPLVHSKKQGLDFQVFESPYGQKFQIKGSTKRVAVIAPSTNKPVLFDPTLEYPKGAIAMAFWDGAQPKRNDQQVCVRLNSPVTVSSPAQIQALKSNLDRLHSSGVALRIDPGEDGTSAQAIIVRQNISLGAISNFKVYLVSSITATGVTTPSSRQIARFDLRGSIGGPEVQADPTAKFGGRPIGADMQPPPWNLCARAIGTELSVKVWPVGQATPSWSNKKAAFAVDLPSNWVYPGYAGGFEMTLSPGKKSVFSQLSVSSPY